MAICKTCNQEMLDADGCIETTICYWDDSDTIYARIPYIQDIGFDFIMPERCHDCGAKPGKLHHQNCDMEDCPRCGEQLISCWCEWDIEQPINPVLAFLNAKEIVTI